LALSQVILDGEGKETDKRDNGASRPNSEGMGPPSWLASKNLTVLTRLIAWLLEEQQSSATDLQRGERSEQSDFCWNGSTELIAGKLPAQKVFFLRVLWLGG